MTNLISYNNIARQVSLVLLSIFCWTVGISQTSITLDNLLEKAVSHAFPLEAAKTEKAIAETQFELYKSTLRPSLGLDLLLPNFTNTSQQVIQPDGSIAFQSLTQNNSSVSLFANQNIAATGGRVFAQSDLQRFDDFSLDFNSYNGVPIRIGIVQPLFAYNPFKWDKKILPLQIKEAEATYKIEVENTKWMTSTLFFNVLIAQANVDIAEKNKSVNEELIKINDERYSLGKSSKDEVLQLQIQYKNAVLSANQAKNGVVEHINRLYTYMGITIPDNASFSLPEIKNRELPNLEALLNSANENRPELIRYERELLENDKQISQTRSDYGVSAQLFAGIGFARASQNIDEIYTNPNDEQQVRFSMSIPLIDWGRKKEAIKIAQLTKENTLKRNLQDKSELESRVIIASKRFLQAQNDIVLLEEIRDAATQRFEISNQRYTLGTISLTDLTLAQRDKDQTLRDYIQALMSYWTSYYEIRTLTGMDI